MNTATKLAGQGIIKQVKIMKQATEDMQPYVDALAQEGYLEQAGNMLSAINKTVDDMTALLALLQPIGTGEIQPEPLEPDILATLKVIGQLDTLDDDARREAESQIEAVLLAGLMNAMAGEADAQGNFIPVDQLPRL